MLAYTLTAGTPFELHRRHLTVPTLAALGAGEVLVKIHAAALNYLDLMVAQGKFGTVTDEFIPGTDGAGVIAALGSSVQGWAVGDPVVLGYTVDWTAGPVSAARTARLRGVTMPGSLAEYAVVPATSLVPMPQGLSFTHAATLPIPATTAWNALVAGQVRPGSTVALLGTGGVSLYALQFAKAAGARVVIISSSDEKLAKARAMGADVTINYRTHPAWDKIALDETNGHGADLIVETIGASTFQRSLNLAAYAGTVYTVGFIGGMSLTMDILPIMSKTLRIIGSQTGSTANLEEAVRAIEINHITPIVDRVFPFNAARDAYDYLESAKHFGKIVIEVADNATKGRRE